MRMPEVKYSVVNAKGGLDQATPTLSLDPGFLKDAVNYECATTGGYSRIGGYERYDGQDAPSDASYAVVQVSSFTNTPSLGDTLTGADSLATGVIIVIESNYMVVTKRTLSYTVGEIVNVGATAIGTVVDTTVSLTVLQNAQYLNLAADEYRSDITAVPGSGSILGVALFNDVRYAFRANAGGTAVDLYKSTSSGWSQVAFEYEIIFSNANEFVSDGDTLAQGAVSATVRRVLVQTGTLASGTNTGRLVISVPSGGGGNFAAGAATTSGSGAGALTLSGAQTAITMAVGGKFEFDTANFFGQSSGVRLYGCDGVNRCFELDTNNYFVPIATGSSPDTPKHIKEFKGHLHVQIGSSNIHSAIGDPYNWTAIAGASEKALGDTLTGYAEQPGSGTSGALAIFGRNNTFMLYGTSAADWNYVTYAKGVGAINYSQQQLAQTLFFDHIGVTTLSASQQYGNFEQSTLTSNINTFIKSKRALTTYSSISRERSQYRVFFSDGYGLYMTLVNGKYLGAIPVYFDNPVVCACHGELSTGEEVLLFGSTNGMVYQLDKGSSFDGAEINAYMKFNWHHAGSPRLLKRWRKGSIEMQGDHYAAINYGYSLAYGSDDEMQPGTTSYSSNFSSSTWDSSLSWDSFFVWDGSTLSPTEVEMEGTSENVQVTISSATDYIYPYTVNSEIFHYTPRRGKR